MKLSCIIIDDEPNAVDLLELLIHQSSEWVLKAKCYDAPGGDEFFKKASGRFYFSGHQYAPSFRMELAALLPKETKIVFTTAYSEYAADSYAFQTIDYLLKPITLKRFLSAMQKIENHFQPVKIHLPRTEQNSSDYFFVRSGKTFHKILMRDILYVEGEREYIKLVSTDARLLIYRRLKEVEVQLPPPFIRVHNSFIVNTERLDKVEDNHIYIAEKRIPVSNKFRNQFMQMINGRLF